MDKVPNFEDASEYLSPAMIWSSGDDVIVLKLTDYGNRAGVSLVRQDRTAWLAGAGADGGEFWSGRLALMDKEKQLPLPKTAPPAEQH